MRTPPFLKGARLPVETPDTGAVHTRPLFAGSAMPLLIGPAIADVDIVAWAESSRQLLEEWLLRHRALLFRGFHIETAARLREFVTATSSGAMLEPPDESTPRASLAERIYESTAYPAHQSIHLHNEASYCSTWPRKIYFCCLQPSGTGGATPLADVRLVASHIPSSVLERFARLGVAYVRNFNSSRIGLSWQEAFWTANPMALEEYCRRHGIEFQWKADGGLRTTTVRPALRRHPISGEMLWFNHAVFFHLESYSRETKEALVAALGSENLPYETHFGDGSAIEPKVIADFLQAFEREKVAFPWQRGDVLLLDNMTIAHGREPYEGDRSIIVAMAEAHRD